MLIMVTESGIAVCFRRELGRALSEEKGGETYINVFKKNLFSKYY